MLILDELWEGQVCPSGRCIRHPEYSGYLRRSSLAEQALADTLSPEQKVLFQALRDRMMDLTAYLERDAFFAGFRTGAMVLMDVLEHPQSQ